MNKLKANSFQELLEQHAGLSYEKQRIFGDVIGSNNWQIDLREQCIFFGNLEFSIQVIGSLAFGDSSWLWGWGNAQSGFSEGVLQHAHQLQALGADNNIAQLTERSYFVEEGFEHQMGMIAAGVLQAKSYYCANYGQGTLVVTIQEKAEQNLIPAIDYQRVERILTTFPQVIQATPLNHKNALIHYLIDRQFEPVLSDQTVTATYQNHSITATFDEADRLLELNGQIKSA